MWKLILGIIINSIILFAILIVTILIISVKKSKNTLGLKFEAEINNKLEEIAKSNGYKFIPSSMYKISENNLFEIDGILITNKVIFVVEIKYLQGIISGDSTSLKLTLTNGKKNKMISNPINQNKKHINKLMKLFSVNVPILSLLILPEDSELKLNQKEQWSVVTNSNKIKDTIIKVLSDLYEKEDISYEKRQIIIENLSKNKAKSYKDKKKFNRIINKKINE
ncbi:Nuclease-related domain [Mycoplasmopsis maculosa]|uniref:Nuclease-related domain n=1 Tax=Mycoplasmopsis maculosa TaxID=114885 RepID=A0A449B3I3_9BACT|nr:nuclease-related domain-containing protein [Mycoplasmopsis maculosa]VEU75161.1 Nuclease-related domain [Mycoplasmopsis maculosa]